MAWRACNSASLSKWAPLLHLARKRSDGCPNRQGLLVYITGDQPSEVSKRYYMRGIEQSFSVMRYVTREGSQIKNRFWASRLS